MHKWWVPVTLRRWPSHVSWWSVGDPRSLGASLRVTRSASACAVQNQSLLRIAREQGMELTCQQLQDARTEQLGPCPWWSNGTFFSTSTCLAWCYLRVVGLPCKMEGFWGFPCRCRTGIADLNGSHLRPAQRLQKVKEERYTAEATLNQLREEMAVLRRKVTQVEGVGSGSRPHKTSNLPKKTPKMFVSFDPQPIFASFLTNFLVVFSCFPQLTSSFGGLWTAPGEREAPVVPDAPRRAPQAAGCAVAATELEELRRKLQAELPELAGSMLRNSLMLGKSWKKKRGKRGKVQWVRIGWSFVFFGMGRWMTLYDKNRYRHEIDEIGGCRYWYFLLT